MAKISLFILIILLFVFASICEADIEISVRGSYSSYWDYYGDGFFFHTFSMDTVGPNTVLDFNRIIRTDHIGNPQVWISFLQNESFALHLAAGYQRLDYSFRDSLIQSIWHWRKSLDAGINLISTGIRIEYLKLPANLYVGGDLGYAFGSLEAGESISYPPDTTLFYTLADGNGDGWFFNYNAGMNIPVIKSFNIFLEYNLRLSPQWHPFKVDHIDGNRGDEILSYIIRRGLDLGRIQGQMFSMGIQYRFNIK